MASLMIPMFFSANFLWQSFAIYYIITDSKLEKIRWLCIKSFFLTILIIGKNFKKAFSDDQAEFMVEL
ncbi:hypothetical protein ACH24_05435 [Francisella persica ATCC VR-331]|uniref:Uncharacterized protein n=1 Tax=Francisella persica ATCC VR-331 TaxID=1086726 RepID=A0AAC9EUF5_9GAMM|nr:hypothetical protein ACH24_05435 [Francisella persica ATCC VR-331]